MFDIYVDIPYTDSWGPQTGTVDVLGGVEGINGYDPTTQNVLGEATFGVNVTPEPATWLLVLGGIGLAAVKRRSPQRG